MIEAPTLPRRAAAATRPAAATRREARRDRNREGLDAFLRELRRDLRCECGRPECHATIPAQAEAYRGRPGRFIVVPRHLAGERVVAAADRFFVVEL